MRNLKNYRVQELTIQEQKEIDGGIIGWLMIGIATGYHVEYYKENGSLKWWY